MFVYIIRFVDTCTHFKTCTCSLCCNERTNSLSAKAEFIDMALNAISFLVYQNFMNLGHIVKYCDVFFKFDNGPYRTMLTVVMALCL